MFGILLRSIDQQVANTTRVTPLVVVPSDELDKVGIQLDTRGSIEDGRGRVANKISRDNGIFSVFNDALVLSLGSRLEGRLDVVVRRWLFKPDDEIDDRDIDGRNTEGETADRFVRVMIRTSILKKKRSSREFSIERGNDLADSLGSTSGRWNDVIVDTTSTTPVLGRGTVDSLLGCGRGVNSAHEALNDTVFVMNDLCKRSEAVSGARSIGNLDWNSMNK